MPAIRARLLRLAAAALLAWPALAPGAPFAYVANGGADSISVIDLATRTPTATITLPVGSATGEMVAAPLLNRVYAGNAGGSVSVIDVRTNTVVATIPTGVNSQFLAINPAQTRLYVLDFNGNAVIVIDTSTNAIVTTIPGFPSPTTGSVERSGARL